MTTQINFLVKGDHRTSTVGTKSEIRNQIANQVKSENPEKMNILLRGYEIELKANWSISHKSVTYFSEIPVNLYECFFGGWGLPLENPKAYIQINGDMSVWMQTNSKKSMWQIIPESEIIIR